MKKLFIIFTFFLFVITSFSTFKVSAFDDCLMVVCDDNGGGSTSNSGTSFQNAIGLQAYQTYSVSITGSEKVYFKYTTYNEVDLILESNAPLGVDPQINGYVYQYNPYKNIVEYRDIYEVGNGVNLGNIFQDDGINDNFKYYAAIGRGTEKTIYFEVSAAGNRGTVDFTFSVSKNLNDYRNNDISGFVYDWNISDTSIVPTVINGVTFYFVIYDVYSLGDFTSQFESAANLWNNVPDSRIKIYDFRTINNLYGTNLSSNDTSINLDIFVNSSLNPQYNTGPNNIEIGDQWFVNKTDDIVIRTLAHELGHSLGLADLNSNQFTNITYPESRYNIMRQGVYHYSTQVGESDSYNKNNLLIPYYQN